MSRINLAVIFFLITIGCSVQKELVKEDFNTLSTETQPVETEFKYNCELSSFSTDKIVLTLNKTKINQEEKITKTQYNLVEKRTLQYNSEDARYCNPFWYVLLPIYLPYYWIYSIDRNQGLKTESQIEKINVTEQPVDIVNGYLEISDENEKILIVNGKAIIKTKILKSKGKLYELKLYENNVEMLKTNMTIEYEGAASDNYFIGKQSGLTLTIEPYVWYTCFRARLKNDNNYDIDLNILSDKLHFFLSDGKQVEGEMYFYYNESFSGNYPDSIAANSFCDFNIRSTERVLISDMKYSTYKLGSKDLTIKLHFNKDTRTIKDIKLQ